VKDYPQEVRGEVFPRGDIVTFEFPVKGRAGPITLKWYSGASRSRGRRSWSPSASP
jgi:hypothetical protein